MPIGFVHLVGIPKQFQSRGYPIFDPTVLEFTSGGGVPRLSYNLKKAFIVPGLEPTILHL